jgi:hypothetical protein
MTDAAPGRGNAALSNLGPTRNQAARKKGLIECEIVIVDDDGNEEPFDPSSWFE